MVIMKKIGFVVGKMTNKDRTSKELKFSIGQLRNQTIVNWYVPIVNWYVPVVNCPFGNLSSLLVLLDIWKFLFVIFPLLFSIPGDVEKPIACMKFLCFFFRV